MQPRTERRAERRRPVNLRATVVYDDGVSRLDAKIVDVSKAGARLELSSPASLPKHFYMLTPPHQLQHCAVVWQADRLVGVLFRLAS
jgi:PilZ domain